MPPRLPVAFAFVVIYFAVAVGGGAEALGWRAFDISLIAPDFSGADIFTATVGAHHIELDLTIAEALALIAAPLALIDAAWRKPRSGLEVGTAWVCAAATVFAPALWPETATGGYAALLALVLGDAIAATPRASARVRRSRL